MKTIDIFRRDVRKLGKLGYTRYFLAKELGITPQGMYAIIADGKRVDADLFIAFQTLFQKLTKEGKNGKL